ncbi:metallophosphoesterase, partial [Acinetobacter baumannii]
MAVPVSVSEWKPAPFDVKGETVFAIGDVHGCADELGDLLKSIAGLAREAKGRRRLVYLGDMINRGPDSVRVLDLWAGSEE